MEQSCFLINVNSTLKYTMFLLVLRVVCWIRFRWTIDSMDTKWNNGNLDKVVNQSKQWFQLFLFESSHFHDKTRRFEIKSVKAVRISIDDSRFIAEVADLNGLQPFLGTILFIGIPLCLRRFRSFLVFHFLEFLF